MSRSKPIESNNGPRMISFRERFVNSVIVRPLRTTPCISMDETPAIVPIACSTSSVRVHVNSMGMNADSSSSWTNHTSPFPRWEGCTTVTGAGRSTSSIMDSDKLPSPRRTTVPCASGSSKPSSLRWSMSQPPRVSVNFAISVRSPIRSSQRDCSMPQAVAAWTHRIYRNDRRTLRACTRCSMESKASHEWKSDPQDCWIRASRSVQRKDRCRTCSRRSPHGRLGMSESWSPC